MSKSKHVGSAHATYVDDNGELRTLSDHGDGQAFHEFKCSFGLSGVVVECQLEVRPAGLCRSETSIAAFDSPQALAAGLLRLQEDSDALLAIVFLDQLASFCDQRYQAGPAARRPLLRNRLAKSSASPNAWLSSTASTASPCKPGDVKIPGKLARSRFTTGYYEQFID